MRKALGLFIILAAAIQWLVLIGVAAVGVSLLASTLYAEITVKRGPIAAAAGPGIVVGTSQKTENQAASTTCVVSISPTAGQALYVTHVGNNSGAVVSCKDNQAADDANWVTDWNVGVFGLVVSSSCHILSVSSGVTSVTVTTTDSGNNSCTATPITFTGGTPAFDVKTNPSATFEGPGPITWTGPPITPTASKEEVIFGVFINENGTPPITFTADSPYTLGPAAVSLDGWYTGLIYRVVASTSGSYTPSGTASDGYTFHGTISFKH